MAAAVLRVNERRCLYVFGRLYLLVYTTQARGLVSPRLDAWWYVLSCCFVVFVLP